ncbi:PP2C family protein-serine/threonine phosphatase [Kitasatospora sp. MAP5-34]|uniref:PP2C family protein-serine/threonine phosphatase n=1 Tax=Kitasatospora sp. MAP5-34 TaxID=3035102 RepID=UPI002475F54B|nr:PP2C family protein-serine/threonine phosphatase [Kitasatospora sp. MAP5-34]MDH6574772.1 sigma-B regulation protein RsbU (phosphoserine phosphatase) [Kitasatospora sp. MAP5-34]
MPSVTALLVSQERNPPPELLTALAHEDVAVEVRTPDEALEDRSSAEVLLAPAAMAPRSLREISRRLSENGPTPIVVVYAQNEFDDIEQHIRLGHDYLVPPFLPPLVRARLRSCYERAKLSHSMEEIQAQAELLSYERELKIGREIQEGFLPEGLPTLDGWDLDVRFRPARKVAGDFYDVFEMVNRRRLALVVADVCDKGVGAALFMALIRSLLRHTAEHSGLQSLMTAHQSTGADPSHVIPVVGATPLMNAVVGTNGYLTRNHSGQGYFATMFFSVLDPATGSLVYINGGHNPPLLVAREGGEPTPLEPTGPAVGVIPDCAFALGYAQLRPGDTLFVYTDGVTEARNAEGEFFGDDRVLALLREPAPSGRALLERMESALREHSGAAEQHDDITMMAVHRMAVPV